MPPTWPERLRHADATVRRVAILDALRASPPALKQLLAHLEHERDERAALLIIRGVAARGAHGAVLDLAHARAVLASVRDAADSTPALAHAALLAHDALTPDA